MSEPQKAGAESVDKTNLNLRNAYKVGSYLRYISLAALHRYPIKKDEEIFIGKQLSLLEEKLIGHEMTRLAGKIEDYREELSSKYEEDERINSEDAEELQDKIKQWRAIVEREYASTEVMTLTNEGMIDIEEAYNNPSQFFGVGVWKSLDKLPKRDFEEACRALAADCPTASVMLAYRAVEYALRDWCDTKIDDSVDRNWGVVLDKLESYYDDEDKKTPVILQNLDYLREKRNEVSHPDRRVDWREAEGVLFRVRNIMEEIYTDHGVSDRKDPDFEDREEFKENLLEKLREQLEEVEKTSDSD